MAVRSHVTGSRSEVSSVYNGSGIPLPEDAKIALKPVQKRPDGIDAIVLEALKGGGHVSACLRGGPLSSRLCQVCKDVARECREGINCKYLSKGVEAHLLTSFPSQADEKEVADEVFRFIKELAATENIRAKQVMATNLKPTEQRVLHFVKAHNQVVQKLVFLQQKQMESKSLQQVEAEVPMFLQSIKADCDKADVASLVARFKMFEDFAPFLQKARDEAAGQAEKKSMHIDSDIVDNFFKSNKFKGDREFEKAFLLMSIKSAPGAQ